ncbi:MAG: hypothetical protein ABIH74_01695 [Candidatus Omnitrophota bacterium]
MRKGIIPLFGAALMCFFAVFVSADIIELKNGDTITGQIIKESEDVVVISKLDGAFEAAISRDRIKTIKKLSPAESQVPVSGTGSRVSEEATFADRSEKLEIQNREYKTPASRKEPEVMEEPEFEDEDPQVKPKISANRTDNLKYDGESIRLDIYDPGGSSRPVVLLIVGAPAGQIDPALGGPGFAQDLKRKGIIAINVQYLDSKGDSNGRFDRHVRAVIEAAKYARSIRNANAGNIALVGYFYGGDIALKAASLDTKIKALAVNAASLHAGFGKENAAFLPTRTLIICGSKDPALRTANLLGAWFAQLGKPFERKINNGIGRDNITIKVFQEDWNIIVKFLMDSLKP